MEKKPNQHQHQHQHCNQFQIILFDRIKKLNFSFIETAVKCLDCVATKIICGCFVGIELKLEMNKN
jgi:hypothetical protein